MLQHHLLVALWSYRRSVHTSVGDRRESLSRAVTSSRLSLKNGDDLQRSWGVLETLGSRESKPEGVGGKKFSSGFVKLSHWAGSSGEGKRGEKEGEEGGKKRKKRGKSAAGGWAVPLVPPHGR